MRIGALMGRGVWASALFGSLVAGCGGEPGVDGGYSESAEAASVSESLPTEAVQAGAEGDSGQLTQGLGGCPGTTVSWSQWQPSWNGNANTMGTYYCYGTLPAGNEGFTFPATLTSTERTGSAQYTCSNGSWVFQGGSCNGKIVNVKDVPGTPVTCSSTEPVKTKWIGWYVSDLKRCPDTAGLDWWVYQYNNNTACFASNNYDGYATKDACFRAHFQEAAKSTGEFYEAQSSGHIAANAEANACGPMAGYPWTNVLSNGATCKYKP